MKLLIDENLPHSFALILRRLGFDTNHVSEVGLENTPDETIVDFARQTGETIVTNDLDFSRIMSLSSETLPSIITFRMSALNPQTFEEIASFNFKNLESAAQSGSLITIDDVGIRVRKLPIY